MKTTKQFIKRLYKYCQVLYRFQALGYVRIYSDDLAESIGLTSVQVRKDFSLFGITGHKRGGYVLVDLISQLNEKLGKDELQKSIIVGAGNIGKALIQYEGFEKQGVVITAAFDIDPMRHTPDGHIPVLPYDDMKGYIEKEDIKMGIIAVPLAAAQQVVDTMVAAGITGVLNFAPVTLKAPDNVFVNSINLVLELETVSYFARALAQTPLNE